MLQLIIFVYDEMLNCVQDDVEQVIKLQYFLDYVSMPISDILLSLVSYLT